ncbi:ATP phosphoribosyltransferase regulatory subunit [Xanthobacter sp. KR7-225]|uniref:ATP phosphoribosyltransferase regulatory subunit n=1 Tax=Xanthobacter sp. KR7-225 TaxID=3156613 RepID=UPI0032B41401
MPKAAPTIAARDPRALEEALLARFEAAGFSHLDPPVLQPADVFLDLSGESIRRRMYLTVDAEGRELCLRPDLTIPVARAILAAQAAVPAAVSYLGPVFRFRGEGSGEFRQAGVESFGRTDVAAADADILALGLDACALYGLPEPLIRLGDVGLFAALLDALPLAPAMRRRLLKDFGQSRLDVDLSRVGAPAPEAASTHSGVLAALTGADPEAARALITDLLSIAGISTVGGRSVSEIAARFLEQAALESGAGLSSEAGAVLKRYLAIAGDPDGASAAMRALAREAGLDLSRPLDLFDARAGFLSAHGVNLAAVRFSTAFGRPLDYYSGMVFELHAPTGHGLGPLVAGGRYDRLLSRLGAPSCVPAVGLAAWVERLAMVGGAR